MKKEIINAYKDGRLMLLLGAGASKGSTDSSGKELPTGEELAQEIAAEMNWEYQGEELGTVYSAAEKRDSAKLHNFLRNRLTNTRTASWLSQFSKYPWSRIFTLNIDDCLENAMRRDSTQKVDIFQRNSPLEELDPIFSSVQIVKLNGSADRPEDGFVFSPQEYGSNSNRLPIWYRELGQNHSNYIFLFIGSKLNEPLFQHAMAEMRSTVKRSPLRGYVITPTASEIEKQHLDNLNLEHIPGTMQRFVSWLDSEFVERPSGWDLATAKRPELHKVVQSLTDKQKRALNSVTVVSAESLPRAASSRHDGVIREFYKGYKPSWSDIVDQVPAELEFSSAFSQDVISKHTKQKCIALVGPAGSGKTTALMHAALLASRHTNMPIYYLREPIDNIDETIEALEEINKDSFYLFIDKIDSMLSDFIKSLANKKAMNCCFIISERLNIWNRRVKPELQKYIEVTHNINRITRNDAIKILEKLEEFGPWTRLKPMTQKQRVDEIFKKSDRQLLIGLMETTTGLGFTNIIKNDFHNSGEDQHKCFLVVIGLASIHRTSISSNIVGMSLSNLGILEDVNQLFTETEGIIETNTRRYSARHPLYVRELFEKVVPTETIRKCLISTLDAFSNYDAPVIRNIGKSDGIVFKSITNHRFVKQMMKNNEDMVLSIYRRFETKFHVDGLYWLQYGLALRDFDRHDEALDKLRTAREAYTSPHIEHAYAQQLIIIAKAASSWDVASSLLDEAIETLRELERMAEATDSYPIVTLAEGHISVCLKFSSEEDTKKIALRYLKELLAAHFKHPGARLQRAVDNINALLNTGAWEVADWPLDME